MIARVSRDGTRKEVTTLPTTPIWRYLDPRKFDGPLGLLTTRALYFRNAYLLLGGDCREGSYPVPDQEQRGETHILRRYCYVSCWQMGEESERMWREYTNWEKGENAVAVVSRYDTLFELLMPQPRIRIAPIHYIDFDTERLRAIEALQVIAGKVYLPFFHKRRKFSHECELRAVNIWPPLTEGEHRGGPDFQLVTVDFDRLIDHVVLPPGAGPNVREWVTEGLKSVGLQHKAVRPSRLPPSTFPQSHEGEK